MTNEEFETRKKEITSNLQLLLDEMRSCTTGLCLTR